MCPCDRAVQLDTVAASMAGDTITSMAHGNACIVMGPGCEYNNGVALSAYLEEAVQCSQRWMCDEIKLEAVQYVQLIAQHALAVLTH